MGYFYKASQLSKESTHEESAMSGKQDQFSTGFKIMVQNCSNFVPSRRYFEGCSKNPSIKLTQ